MRRSAMSAVVALASLGAWAAVEQIELDNWQLQDATVVREESVRDGWFREDSAKCSTEGREISRNGFKMDGWYKATVPGTILTTLVNCGVYPEPTYGENNRPEVIPESLCRKDWWYRTKIKVPEDFKDRLVWLEFDGINYQAEIWVNGRKAGAMKGAFKRGKFDITKYDVRPGQDTTIAVRISPQPTVGVPSEHTMGTTGGPCGGVARLDGPVFGCSVGWDWMSGVRDRNSGLWRRVRLVATGPAVLLDSLIQTDLPDLPKLDKATVKVEIPVRNATDKALNGSLTMAFDDVKIVRPVTLAPWGTVNVAFDPAEEPSLVVRNPKLWWPNGLGEANLHDMKFTLEIGGKVSATREEKFGIRKFEYFRAGDEKLRLHVNGVHVFMRGGNWGTEEMCKRIDRARLDAQVRLHRDAGFNMIRDWGGQSPSDELFELCDKYGMLFWEDLWQFNSIDPIDTNLYFANVRDHVLRYRNHACMVIWGSRNEATPPKYLDDEMRYLLMEIAPMTHYQANSGGGNGFNSGGPYDWVPPTRHSRYWEDKRVPRHETFKTEIGSFVVPTIESVQSMMPEKDWQGFTHAWGEHSFTSGGGRKIPRFMRMRYGEIANFADFCRKGQLMTYEVHKAMFEGRFGRLFDPAEGALLWMSIPAQPSLVWNVIAYDLEPHAGFFACQDACAPLHVFYTDTDRGTVFVVNHNPKKFTGKAKLVLRNLDGTVAGTKTFDVAVDGPASVALGRVDWPANLSKVHFIELELADSAGKKVDDNFYWHNNAVLDVKPEQLSDDNKIVGLDDFKDLDKLPQVTLEARAKSASRGDVTRVGVELKNPSDKTVALMAHVQLRAAKSGARVLPAYYSDNYVSLPPKAVKTIVIECASAALAGDKPLVTVDGWNVKVKETEMVVNNRNADPQDKRWAHQKGFGLIQPALVAKDIVRVNCGGYNRGAFTADPGFVEGACGFQTEEMDLSANDPRFGPPDIYRTVRWDSSVYSNLLTKANAPCTVRLHLCEHSRDKGPGKNMMNVVANGQLIAENLDPAAVGGRVYKAGVIDIKGAKTDANGLLVLEFQKGKKVGSESRDPRINAFEIIPD